MKFIFKACKLFQRRVDTITEKMMAILSKFTVLCLSSYPVKLKLILFSNRVVYYHIEIFLILLPYIYIYIYIYFLFHNLYLYSSLPACPSLFLSICYTCMIYIYMDMSRPESNGNEGVLYTPLLSKTGAHYQMLFSVTNEILLFLGVLPFCRGYS